jgi:hypothetical protein
MSSLVLDTPKSGRVTEEQVLAIPTPDPTNTYQPVAYGDFVHLIGEVAGMYGLQLGEKTYGIDKEGKRLFGTAELVNQNILDNRAAFMLGFRTSHDKTLSAGVCFGAKVFVCSNLCFSGYADEENGIVGNVRHRHNKSISWGLFDRIKLAMECFGEYRDYQNNFYSQLEETPLTQDQAYSTIVKAVKANAIPNAQVVHVANQWDKQPEYPTGINETLQWESFRHRNAFSLLNAFTEVHKEDQEGTPIMANNRSIGLSNFFDAEFIVH